MIDPSSLTAAINCLRLATELVKSIMGTHDVAAMKETAMELTGVLINAHSQTLATQTQLAEANNEIRQLKCHIAKMERWATETERYEIAVPRSGVFVYQLKKSQRGSEPAFPVCPKCFQEAQRHILQQETLSTGRVEMLTCPNCSAEVTINERRQIHPRAR